MSAAAAGALGATGVIPTREVVSSEKHEVQPAPTSERSEASTLAGEGYTRHEQGGQVDVKDAEARFEVSVSFHIRSRFDLAEWTGGIGEIVRSTLTLVISLASQSLRRELSRQSSAHRTKSGQKDAEKEGEDDDDFDLLSYLRGQQSKADEAGMHRKVVGVSWTDLTVVGAGGMKVSVVFSSRCFRNSSVSLTEPHSDLHSYLPRRCERGSSLASHQILENHQVRSFQGFSSESSRIFRRLPQARRALSRSWSTWIWMYHVPQDYR